MRAFIRFFINRPLIVNLLTVMIILVGALSMIFLKKEIFPSVDFDFINVSTVYPGSSSEDVEKLITIPLEREVKGVDGIRTLNGVSAEGVSFVYMEIDPDYDIDEVLQDVRNAIDKVDDLPDEALKPQILSVSNKLKGIISIVLTGAKYEQLRFHGKKLRDILERDKDIAQIDFGGYRADEVRIEVDPVKLKEYEVTMSQIVNAVRSRNINISAGKIKSLSGDSFVRTVSEFEKSGDIGNVLVRANYSGNGVRVNDVAKVTRRPEILDQKTRSNGEEALYLEVKMKESGDIIDTVDRLKGLTENYFKDNVTGELEFRYADDASYFVRRRLDVLKDNGILGIFLVFGCLLFFLNFRTSVITSMGAPLAFMISFIAMDYMGYSLNLISMFALILVLGMLVDDSIIVAERYFQFAEKGMPPKEAAEQAAVDTVKPVLATILTTVIAFGSLFFMGGIMGKFLLPVPIVIIITLAASLFECFVILPSHLADFAKVGEKVKGKKRWYDPLRDIYTKCLEKALTFPKTVLVAFFALLFGSIVVATKMKFELFPGDDATTVFIQLKGKVGTPITETDRVIGTIEKAAISLMDKTEFTEVKGLVGQIIGDFGLKTGTHYGAIGLYLTQELDRERSVDEILNGIVAKTKELAPDYNVSVKKMAGGPPTGKPVQIDITGENLDNLYAVAKRAEIELAKIEGITATEIDFELGNDQFLIEVDDLKARRLGLDTTTIARELRYALAEDEISEIVESDEDIKIRINIIDEERRSKDVINQLSVLNNQGKLIPISKVINVTTAPGAFVVRREERKRIVSLTAEIDRNTKTSATSVPRDMRPIMKKIVLDYDGVSFAFGGENKDTQESLQRLGKSAFISLFCIFLVLVIMFGTLGQPFVIMSCIPLGLIGVVWTFLAFGEPLGFMAVMGIVGLIGVVVNDSIVLVSFINTQKEIMPIFDAVLDAGRQRFRAVILTTFTTVAGLMPIAHARGGDPFLKPMALSFAWGLLFASAVTLIFIPCAYLVYHNGVEWIKKKLP